MNLNSHIRDAIEQAITEQFLPSFENTLGGHEMGSKTKMDLTSGGQQRSPEVKKSRKAWENHPGTDMISNQRCHNRENSLDSQNIENDYDICAESYALKGLEMGQNSLKFSSLQKCFKPKILP